MNQLNSNTPPIAEKIDYQVVSDAGIRNDPYFWMRLSDEQKDSEVQDEQTKKVFDYLNAENDYFQNVMKPTEKLQRKLYAEMTGRIKQEDESVPFLKNGYWYYVRYSEGSEYPVYCRKKGSLEAQEEILLDVNVMAKGHEYYNVVGLSVSEDNTKLAYGLDTISRRIYTIYFMDLVTGEYVGHPIPNTEGYVAWANDNKTIFYSKKDEETLRPDRIYRHIIGDSPEADKLIYHEKDETFYTAIEKSKSKKFLIIGSTSTLASYYKILDADNPLGEFTEFTAKESELEYQVEHFHDKFYILTNLNAPNFRLMETTDRKTSKELWKEIIPHRKDVLLEDIDVFEDFFVLSERYNASTNISIIEHGTGKQKYLPFEETAYTVFTKDNYEINTEWLRFRYTSLTTPNTVYDFNMRTGEQILRKRETVVGGYNPSEYKTERIWAVANDGTKIPMSVVYKKGLTLNGNNPALLYGYGSYGISIDPEFSSKRLSLLDRGFIFAIAHIRGGQEMGRHWYEDGKMFKKINTFTDFINCAEHLIKEGYTSSDKLFAQGGSAGGLLMGAIINLRPDLFKGIIAQVPFVDVVSTMLDESIPLTTGEFDEWGNPKNEESYKYMLSYSPYDNIQSKEYPNILITTGLHDSQVQYWEPAKWTAKLRDLKTDNNVLCLRTNMETGHGGTTGRFKVYEEIAQEFAFVLMISGIEN
ncbi:protease II [Sporocytophaga myxococcoides]|uniref:Proline-specific endopeptidase n=1 Tax=Sporocytophaga myxococcoides TaxID=153721 RepID=A0A098LGC8_9BACT|nr:oligopeptidase B [Sporocytophaga myxococcoides]GAL85514.1 protease II [Sporocytophaga myxococcoides]